MKRAQDGEPKQQRRVSNDDDDSDNNDENNNHREQEAVEALASIIMMGATDSEDTVSSHASETSGGATVSWLRPPSAGRMMPRIGEDFQVNLPSLPTRPPLQKQPERGDHDDDEEEESKNK